MEQVTLAQLRYAVAVDQMKSFRAAAESVHISPSGLSMQIHKLEELLGVSLFDRGKKPLIVTADGEKVLEQAHRVLREMERLGQVTRSLDGLSGRYRLGVIPTLAPVVLPLALHDFVKKYPRVTLEIEELTTEEIIQRLAVDTLDAGIMATPLHEAGLTEAVLGIEQMVAYLPEDDPLLERATVSQTALRSRPLWVMAEGHCFRTQVLAYCGGAKPPAPGGVRFEGGSFDTLIRLVDAGMGATILPELVARELDEHIQRRRVRPLVDPIPVREIGLVTARTDLRREITSALIDTVRAALTSALQERSGQQQRLAPI